MNNQDQILKALSNDLVYLTPVEWGEANRVLSKKDSRFHGNLSFKLTPYLIKITNSFMPNRLAEIISIKKGSQVGFSSACVYTILGWIMSESPANTLFITENEAKLKDQMQGPINQMINSSGLVDLVGSRNIREREIKGRRKKATGDTLTGIDFGDGFLHTISGQVISSLSSWNIKYGIYDEVERWKGEYKSAGDFMGLIGPRHKSYGNERRILLGSTPEVKQTSNIEPLYELGDQQKYMIPCKCCGEMIEFVWSVNVNDEAAGIYYERESNGKFIENSARYICQNCGGTFKETHKFDMYDETYLAYKNNSSLVCDWVPTAIPESPIYESYHISSLYSPNGFYSWNDLARNWCSIHPVGKPIKIKKLQSFYNQELGLTWEERGKEIKINQLLKNTRNYDIDTVPNALSIQDGNGRILLLTCAVDLNGKEDDARLDWEVLAWSESGSSYSINHGSIGTFQRSKAMRSGKAKQHEDKEEHRIKWTYRMNQPNNVWDEFKATVMAKVYEKDDGGKGIRPPIFGIDTGHFTVHAKAFVAANPLCVSLKGKSDDKYTAFDSIKKYYTESSKVPGLYLVEGDLIKDDLSDSINLIWSEDMGIDQPAGFMNYPNPVDGKYTYKTYFHEYEGEKREIKLNDHATAMASRWVKKHSSVANHYWDVRVYQYPIRDIIADKFCKSAKIPSSWDNFTKIFK